MPQLVHTLDSHVDLVHDGVTLFSYVYRSLAPKIESPRPYFHPLCTLKGNVVSGFRPHDHRWHHGLSLTCANLSGHNFWGGPTYVRDEGYVQLENNGWQLSENLHFGRYTEPHFDEPGWLQTLDWRFGGTALRSNGPTLMQEIRRCWFAVNESADFWEIKWFSKFTRPKKQEPLIWGSPTTQGRENAGYGGLFWRGPRDFIGGEILMSDGRSGADSMGERSPWLAYIGQHDETDDYSTLIWVDDAKNPRHPTPWFVRNTTPMVCPYFAFHEEYGQQPREVLELNYRIIIADGKWNREQIEATILD